MKSGNLLLLCMLLLALGGCLKEELDLDNLSTEVAFERSIAMPLIYSSLHIEDFTDGSWDSLIITDGDTIKLYLIIDLDFSDTIELGDLGKNMEFEYLYLYHGFTNSLPIGLDIQLILFDSVLSRNLDTIYLNDNHSELFLEPAVVDGNGMVIEDLVSEQKGMTEFESSALDYLQNEATHLIFDGVIPNTGGMVKILDYFSLDLRMGIEAKGTYVTDLDSIN